MCSFGRAKRISYPKGLAHGILVKSAERKAPVFVDLVFDFGQKGVGFHIIPAPVRSQTVAQVGRFGQSPTNTCGWNAKPRSQTTGSVGVMAGVEFDNCFVVQMNIKIRTDHFAPDPAPRCIGRAIGMQHIQAVTKPAIFAQTARNITVNCWGAYGIHPNRKPFGPPVSRAFKGVFKHTSRVFGSIHGTGQTVEHLQVVHPFCWVRRGGDHV